MPAPVTRSVETREHDLQRRAAEAILAGVAPGPIPSGDPDDDLVAVRILEAAGRREAARGALLAVQRAHPADPLVRLAVARARDGDGDRSGAAALYERLVADGVEHDALPVLLGRALLDGPDPTRGERLLREELAEGPRFVDAALALCDRLTDDERFADARAVVAAARARDPGRVDLGLVDARLAQDCWELDRAANSLRALIESNPDLAAAQVQLAEVERAAGNFDAARAALATVRPDDPWAAGHRERIDALRRDLDGERRGLSVRDMLAMVRGAADTSLRLRALDALLGVPAVRDDAIRLAFAQDDPLFRIRAIRAIPADDPALPDDLEVALSDPDPRVRGTALRRTIDLPDPESAVELARTRMEAEEHPYAFRAAHEALVARLGPLVPLPPDGELDPGVRQKTREAWRRECPE